MTDMKTMLDHAVLFEVPFSFEVRLLLLPGSIGKCFRWHTTDQSPVKSRSAHGHRTCHLHFQWYTETDKQWTSILHPVLLWTAKLDTGGPTSQLAVSKTHVELPSIPENSGVQLITEYRLWRDRARTLPTRWIEMIEDRWILTHSLIMLVCWACSREELPWAWWMIDEWLMNDWWMKFLPESPGKRVRPVELLHALDQHSCERHN